MRAIAFVLALVSPAFTYTILTPNSSQGWTNQGSQELTWQRVDTDPLEFSVVLNNMHIPGFERQVLAVSVDGTLGKTSLNPHNGGWPTGTGFRINFARDGQHLDAVMAQSSKFSILPSS